MTDRKYGDEEARTEQNYKRQAQPLIKKVINRRRRQSGLLRRLPSLCWTSPKVKTALESAMEALEACGWAEWEELEQEPHFEPEDTLLAQGLNRLFYAVNAWESLSATTVQPTEKTLTSESRKSTVELTAAQEEYVAAEAEYLRWMLEINSKVAAIRRWVPERVTEEQLVGMILNPIAQVLSFEECTAKDLDIFGLSKLVSERLALGVARPVASRVYLGEPEPAYKPGSGAAVAYEVCVETAPLSAEKGQVTKRCQGERLSWVYGVGDSHIYRNILNTKSAAELEGLIFCSPEELEETENYIEYAQLRVSYYSGSVVSQLLKVCRIVIKNGFAINESSALRYLLMDHQEAHIPFEVQEGEPWFCGHSNEVTGYRYIVVPPWALPQQVEECWKQSRPQGVRVRRLPAPDSVELFRYVLAHTPPGETPRWSSLATRWTTDYGKQMTRDKILRTFHSVRKALTLQVESRGQKSLVQC